MIGPDDATGQGPDPGARELADRLHSAAIHLLRRLRRADSASGLTAPRLSALSVVVFAGPLTLTELAAAEQVRPPTMSRLVRDLEAEGLLSRRTDAADRRVQWLEATGHGRRLLEEGRARRVGELALRLARLDAADRRRLEEAAGVLEDLALPADHPARRRHPAPGTVRR
jgi:DNA-binding MarR family transcriptional regulator